MTKQSIKGIINGLPRSLSFARNDGFTLADIRCKKQSVCTDYPNGQTLTPALSHRRGSKYAFTLAEVLITLVIIGVIAAITVPTLITKYQKEQTVTRLKKAYSALAQTTQRAIADNGPIKNWEIGRNDNVDDAEIFAKQYLFPYLSLGKYCRNSKTGNCNLFPSSDIRFYLSDGTFIGGHIGTYNNPPTTKFFHIAIDINGIKKPNKSGKDQFGFDYIIYDTIYPQANGKLIPNGFSYTRKEIIDNAGYGCNNLNNHKTYCTALIMKDGWQIKDDYPW